MVLFPFYAFFSPKIHKVAAVPDLQQCTEVLLEKGQCEEGTVPPQSSLSSLHGLWWPWTWLLHAATWQGQRREHLLRLCRADPNQTAFPRVLTMTSSFGAMSRAGALATVCSHSAVPSSRPCRPLGGPHWGGFTRVQSLAPPGDATCNMGAFFHVFPRCGGWGTQQ